VAVLVALAAAGVEGAHWLAVTQQLLVLVAMVATAAMVVQGEMVGAYYI
jgi:hypothetical protein